MADTLLVVEPDSKLREQIANFFGKRGFSVLETGSVGEALAVLVTEQPDVALLNTPLDEDAATVAFAVRRQAPGAALVIMGFPPALDDFRTAMWYEIRPEAYLEKPFKSQQLASQVETSLRALRDAAASRDEAREASAALGNEVGALAEALAQLAPARKTTVTGAPRPERRSVAPPAPEPVGPDPSEPVLSAPPGAILPEADLPTDSEDRYRLAPLVAREPQDPRGIYGPVTMAELLYNCFRDLYTGQLVLRRGDVWKTVRLMSGRPVQAASNVQSENLGALLVAAGRITRDQNERSVEMAREGGGRQGEILVRMGALTREALRSALRDQIRVRILSCFHWTHAEYGLGYDPQMMGGVEDNELNPLLLIFEGLKSAAPIEPLARHFDGAMRRHVNGTARLASNLPLLREHPEAAELAGLCDGSRILAEVLAECPLGLIDALRVLRALEVMDCVALGELRPLASFRGGSPSSPPRRVRPVGQPEPVRSAWFNPPGTNAEGSVPRRTVTSRPAEARPAEFSTPPPARREASSLPPPRPTGDVPRPTGSGFRAAARPAGSSSGAPVARAEATTSGSFRAVVRPRPTEPPERPGVGGMRPPLPRPTRPTSEGAVDAPTPAAQLRQEIERIERGENLYEVMGLEPTVALRAIRDQSQRLLRLLNADQVARLDDTLLDRARQAARRVAEATETLGTRPQRDTYDALNLPVGRGSGVDLLAAESSFTKGQICLQHNLGEKAQRFFALASEQDPHQALYRVYQAWAAFSGAPADDKRTRAKALDDAREALEAVSGRDDACVLVADMALSLGHADLATRFFNRALDVNSGNLRAREGLIAIEKGEGDRKGADPKAGSLLNKLFSRR